MSDTKYLAPFNTLTNYQLESLFLSAKDRVEQYLLNNNFHKYLEQTISNESMTSAINCKYYNEDEFVKHIYTNGFHITVYHMNIGSLPKHHIIFKAYLQCLKLKFDVITLSEIGHNYSSIQMLSNLLEDYDFDFVPSPTSKGGVGIFFKKCYSDFKFRKQLISENLPCQCSKCQVEDIWLEFRHDNKTYTFCTCYRHPGGNITHFVSALESSIQTMSSKAVCFFCGDINIDLLQADSCKMYDEYLKLMLCSQFIPSITLPTRITDYSITLIDHIFVRLPEKMLANKIKSGNLFCDISDHLPNFCCIEGKNIQISKDRPMVRMYNSRNFDNFHQALASADLSSIYSSDDPNHAYEQFINIFKQLHKTHFPLVKLSRKRMKDKSWITPGIKTSIKHKNVLLRKYIKKQSPALKSRLKRYKQILGNIVHRAQREYYDNILSDRQTYAKNAWKIINETTGKKSKKSTLIEHIVYDGQQRTTNQDIANAFNDYFSTVGAKLAQQINVPGNDNDINQYLTNPQHNSLFLSPISDNEIQNEILKLKIGKSAGLDEIPNKLVKSTSQFITPFLTHIFNLVLSKGKYPDLLKVAKVIPIYKKGDSTLPENYRPISLLSCFNKLLEKMIEKRIKNFLLQNNSLYDYQFGFRTGYSTSQALLEISHTIYSQLNNNNNILGLYLDLKKAFDTVDHTILLQKLSHYGIRGNAHALMKSYLLNRKQTMYVNRVYSGQKNITTGVPQGSVLGPLLFLIYVNDIQTADPGCSMRLFADDTNVFIHDKNCMNLTIKASQTISNLQKWFNINKLTLHLGKTNYTVFHCKRDHNKCCPDHFYVNQTKICRASSVKYLGVLIDEDLSWKDHIQDLTNKLVKYTSIFFHIREKIPPAVALQMYYGLVYSRLSYGIEIYGMAKSSTISPLQVMQNRLLKILTFKHRRFPTNSLYQELEILKVSDIHNLRLYVMIYKYVTGKLPEIFNNIFQDSESQPGTINTRNNSLFNVTRQNNIYGKLMLNNYGFNLWQRIPISIKQSTTLSSFKSAVKKYLMEQYS